jgi:capsular exopolysaccharide synthesis family protein
LRPSSTSRRSKVLEARFPDNADIQARLVTGASSAASLEQYRRLAATLHEEQVHRQLKTVMITSAVPQEGKTLTVVNLALTLSHSYARRVLVIDADLRWPGLHTVLDIPNERGLSEALRDRQQELPFVRVSSRLSALTAGRPGPTPLAGLASRRMGEVIEACAAQFDWVLIDTSPVGVLPDAQVLTRLAGAVILVIGAGSTPASAVERAVSELGGPDSIMGIVLNKVDERRIPAAGYYGHYGTSHDLR